MTVDHKCYDFAQLWLKAGGWTSELDIRKLAFLIDDVCKDFVLDLEHMAEEERDESTT